MRVHRLSGLDFMEESEIKEYVAELEARVKELEEAVAAGVKIHRETLNQLLSMTNRCANAEADRDQLREVETVARRVIDEYDRGDYGFGEFEHIGDVVRALHRALEGREQ